MPEEAIAEVRNAVDPLDGDPAFEALLQEILAGPCPAATSPMPTLPGISSAELTSGFRAELTELEKVLDPHDSYEAILDKIRVKIDALEEMRDQLLAQLCDQIRPIEASYWHIVLFFENCKGEEGKQQSLAELWVLNADTSAIKDVESSTTVAVVENFCQTRNDSFNFRVAICNLVIPGYLPQSVREKFEDAAKKWGMLLVTDTEDDKSFENVERGFLPNGKYEFMMRPEDRAAASVVTAGYLQLRPAHWFERGEAGEGLYGPASLAFAGALARTDESMAPPTCPIGPNFGQIVGVEKSHVELRVSEASQLSLERQLVLVARPRISTGCSSSLLRAAFYAILSGAAYATCCKWRGRFGQGTLWR